MFGRRSDATTKDATGSNATTTRRRGSTAVDVAALQREAAEGGTGGKGRPTPKRREAEAARKAQTKPARNRREAMARDRATMREQRLKQRQALETGDERHLPARDKGPVKRFVRDYIDSRRSAAEFFMIIALIVLFGSFIRPVAPYITLFWLVAIIVIVVDAAVMTFLLRRALEQRFGSTGESTRGAIPYALMRSLQWRRLRLPKPMVKPGQQPRA